MAFTCRQCGSCCMYLGDYIVIEQQTGEFSFTCSCVSTGTEFTAEVDEDKRHLFTDFSFPDRHPSACRFLRPDGNLLRCTIHRDSPAQCKFYRCEVMMIFDGEEKLLGTVRGTLDLHSDNAELRSLWDGMMGRRPASDADGEAWIAAVLEQNGYRVE